MLAYQAEADVRQLIPAPLLTKSPDLPNNVDKSLSPPRPVTYVNLWVWFWSTSDVWTTYSRTVGLNGVTATATATPVSLTFDPGNGDAPVVCTNPGRAWTDADGNVDPSTTDGCGYRYSKTTPNGPITGRLLIDWDVSWTSNVAGFGGPLDPLATYVDTPPFMVEQIQVVTR